MLFGQVGINFYCHIYFTSIMIIALTKEKEDNEPDVPFLSSLVGMTKGIMIISDHTFNSKSFNLIP